ncbi:hypothetical protein ACXYMO_17650 [Arenibacterium sp. CAU 1754]
MSTSQDYFARAEELADLLRDKMGVRAKSFPAAFQKARRRLPRKVQKQGDTLIAGLSEMSHPKLRQTVDTARLDAADADIREFLQSIDVADRRKGWWLGVLGGVAFNILAVLAIVLVFLVWRGYL